MLEVLNGGIFGSILGGVFRLAPELLKAFDRKNERTHELSMFDRQCKLEEQRGAQKLAETSAQRDLAVDSGAMSAFQSAIEQQADMVRESTKGFIAALSASVRPAVTYWVLLIWSCIHIWYAVTAWSSGAPPDSVFKQMMSPDFSALVSGTINYWFLDRTLSKRGL